MTTKKPHASAGTKSPASSEESTASTAVKTAEKPPTGSVAGYVASASSKATKRAYASDVRHFIQHGGAIPATPAMVAEYLAKLAPTMKVATLERRCVSIAQAHSDQGLKSPTRADVVVATMKGIRRQHGTRQVVFTSTIAAFGPPLPDLVPDDIALHPTTMYGVTKVAGELLGDYVARKGNVDGVRIWAIGQAVAVGTQIDILLDPRRGRDGAARA